MMIFKNSESVSNGQCTFLLMPTCFGFFKDHQKLKLQCRDGGVKLLHIKHDHTMFFQNFKSNICVHWTALIWATYFGIFKIHWKLDIWCPDHYVKETRVKT